MITMMVLGHTSCGLYERDRDLRFGELLEALIHPAEHEAVAAPCSDLFRVSSKLRFCLKSGRRISSSTYADFEAAAADVITDAIPPLFLVGVLVHGEE